MTYCFFAILIEVGIVGAMKLPKWYVIFAPIILPIQVGRVLTKINSLK